MRDLTATLSHVVCQGVQRMRMLDFLPGTPFLTARALEIPEPIGSSPEIEARLLNLRRLSINASRLLPQVPQELIVALESTEPAGALADLAATFMDIRPKDKQEILEAIDPVARMDKVARLLSGRMEVVRLSNEIGLEAERAALAYRDTLTTGKRPRDQAIRGRVRPGTFPAVVTQGRFSWHFG